MIGSTRAASSSVPGRISPEALSDLVDTQASTIRALTEEIVRLREAALAPRLVPPPRLLRLFFRLARRPRPWQRLADWHATLPDDVAYRAWALAHEPPLVVSPEPERPAVAFWVRLLPGVKPARYRLLAESVDRLVRPGDRTVYVADEDCPEVFGQGWKRVHPADAGAAGRILSSSSVAWVLWLDTPGVVPFWLWAALGPMLRADADVLYADEDMLRDGHRTAPHFKPDFAPAMLRATHYLTGLLAVRRKCFEAAWPVASGYALALAVARESVVRHVPEVLFSATDPPVRADEEEWQALSSAVDTTRFTVKRTTVPTVFAVTPRVKTWPTVAAIIPSRDNWPYLSRCLASLEQASYPKLSIVVVDNGSRDAETLAGLSSLTGRIRVRRDDSPFHFARLMNAAAREVDTEVLLFLNDDTEALSPDWIESMVVHLLDPSVGAVGAVLLFPDGRIQHAGVVLGIRGGAAHAFKFHPWNEPAYHHYPRLIREWSAVTGACLAVRRDTFWDVGGFDEAFAASFNDIDFCLRLQERGLRVLCTPEAQLVHHETVSRPRAMDPEEVRRFQARWGARLAQPDPYYSPHLSQWTENFTPRVVEVLAPGSVKPEGTPS